MDPLTQGLLGAAAAQALFGSRLGRWAGAIGMVAGWLPDADVFYTNPSDPVHDLIYHRHITHALAAIPLGGVLSALPFLAVRSLRDRRKEVVGAALAGWATHAPLDACTSYGTQLLLPFSDARISWDILPIVDLFFTPVLLVGVVATFAMRKAWPARAALAVAVAYALAGFWMRERAENAMERLAEARGHAIERSRAMPMPGTLVLWRAVYLDADGIIHADGVRTPWIGRTLAKQGGCIPLATYDDVVALAGDIDGARRAFDVFAWFSDGYVAIMPGEGAPAVGDMRYAAGGESMTSLWAIRFEAEGPVRWRPPRMGDRANDLWRTLTQGDPGYVGLDE